MTAATSGPAFWKPGLGAGPENYERYFVPVIGRPLAERLVAEAELHRGERVLDVACGTGIVTRLAAEQVGPSGSAAGLDVNAGMLSVARSIAAAANAPIRWYETTAESIPLPDDTFDVVLCQLGLMFVADKDAAVREMRRVTVPGGRILVSVPTPTPFFDVLDGAFERHLPAGAGFVRAVFSLNDTVEVERLFRDAGLEDFSVRRESLELLLPSAREFLWQYVQSTPLAGVVERADSDILAALERDVVNGWRPWVRDDGLASRQGMIIATART
ncbi:MAG TPA: methyltransferase domain-containing protein [Gemmatimonadaceae bacterium]|nr:methyltransferase domain-containing protein [Gemmatimonadaceae bacterium]